MLKASNIDVMNESSILVIMTLCSYETPNLRQTYYNRETSIFNSFYQQVTLFFFLIFHTLNVITKQEKSNIKALRTLRAVLIVLIMTSII